MMVLPQEVPSKKSTWPATRNIRAQFIDYGLKNGKIYRVRVAMKTTDLWEFVRLI